VRVDGRMGSMQLCGMERGLGACGVESAPGDRTIRGALSSKQSKDRLMKAGECVGDVDYLSAAQRWTSGESRHVL